MRRPQASAIKDQRSIINHQSTFIRSYMVHDHSVRRPSKIISHSIKSSNLPVFHMFPFKMTIFSLASFDIQRCSPCPGMILRLLILSHAVLLPVVRASGWSPLATPALNSSWQALGPFPIGMRELPYLSSPLEAMSSDEHLFLGLKYGEGLPYISPYGIDGLAAWGTFSEQSDGWVHIGWNSSTVE